MTFGSHRSLRQNSYLSLLSLGIQTFFTEPPVYYGPIMAALTIASVPMIIMFLFLQKYYVQGISTSGIKG